MDVDGLFHRQNNSNYFISELNEYYCCFLLITTAHLIFLSLRVLLFQLARLSPEKRIQGNNTALVRCMLIFRKRLLSSSARTPEERKRKRLLSISFVGSRRNCSTFKSRGDLLAADVHYSAKSEPQFKITWTHLSHSVLRPLAIIRPLLLEPIFRCAKWH